MNVRAVGDRNPRGGPRVRPAADLGRRVSSAAHRGGPAERRHRLRRKRDALRGRARRVRQSGKTRLQSARSRWLPRTSAAAPGVCAFPGRLPESVTRLCRDGTPAGAGVLERVVALAALRRRHRAPRPSRTSDPEPPLDVACSDGVTRTGVNLRSADVRREPRESPGAGAWTSPRSPTRRRRDPRSTRRGPGTGDQSVNHVHLSESSWPARTGRADPGDDGQRMPRDSMLRKRPPRNRLQWSGVRGFEPPTPASRRQCSTRLSYTPCAPCRNRGGRGISSCARW